MTIATVSVEILPVYAAGVLGDGADVHGKSPEKVRSNPLSEHLLSPAPLLGRSAE
jgi:hypothetical protein